MPDDPLSIEPSLQFHTDDVPDAPITFSIDGESFSAIPWLTGSKFIKYSRMMQEGGLQATILVDTFFRDVMDQAEYERFDKFIDDPTRRVKAQTLADIFLALFARYSTGANEADRPTPPPAPSASGRGNTARTSKGNVSSAESTPAG